MKYYRNIIKYLPFALSNLICYVRFWGLIVVFLFNQYNVFARQADTVKVIKRYVSIDNVCAWPNLTALRDGTQIATIFNKPSHGRMQGDVECWASTDGGNRWTKIGTPAPHEPLANRMNVAAGLAGNGDMIVIASGWSLKESGKQDGLYDLISVIQAWVSRSKDGGKTWKIDKNAFPAAEPGFTEYIPFGDILKAGDGSLRVLAYNQSDDKAINTVSMFRSTDDGRTWKWYSRISDGKGATAFASGHNETAFFHTGGGNWIASARRWKGGQAMDLFSSGDDGKTWKMLSPLTGDNQHPGHIIRLKSGDLLLTFGNRKTGSDGVAVKVSKDNGKTWSDTQLIISDLASSDCGYPASVQLDDGSIMTVYYANAQPAYQRYHMGTVIWRFQ
jgi:hypothetical protein